MFMVTCQIMGSDHCNLDGHSIGSKKMQHLTLPAFGALLAFMIPVTTVSAWYLNIRPLYRPGQTIPVPM